MSAEVKPQEAAPRPPRMCPTLTGAALIGREIAKSLKTSSIITAPGGEPAPTPDTEAVACQQGNCALFISRLDENGKVVGGDCSMTLNPIAANQQAMALVEIGKTLSVVLANFSVEKS